MRNLRLFAALLFGFVLSEHLVSAQVSDIGAEVRSRLAAAHSAERAGNHAGAAKEYQAVLQLRPDLSVIRQSLGITYHLQNRFIEAIAEFQRAIEQDGSLWGAFLFLGMDLYKTNQFGAAIAPLERSIELNAKMAEPEARFWLGVTYSALGKPEQAIPHLRRSEQLRPDDLEVSYQLTRAYDRAAGSAFERIGAIEPSAAAVLLLQGERFQQENRHDLARIELIQAAQLRPDYAGWLSSRHRTLPEASRSLTISSKDARALLEWSLLYEELAATMLAQTMLDAIAGAEGAGAEAEQLLSSARSHLRAAASGARKQAAQREAFLKAMAALEAGKPDDAIQVFKQSFQKGANPWLARMLLRAYSEGGYDSEAESLARELLAERTDDVDVLLLLGRHYKRLAGLKLQAMIQRDPDAYRVRELQGERYEGRTDFDAAVREYKAALSKNPDAAGLRYAVGNVYAKSKQYEAAERWLKDELQRNPHHTLAHARLGSVYVEQGRATEAIHHLEEALRANGALNSARLDLGRAYTTAGRYDDAVTALKIAAAAEPDNDRVHYLLANAYTRQGRRQEAQAEMARYQQLTRERLARTQREVRAVSESVK